MADSFNVTPLPAGHQVRLSVILRVPQRIFDSLAASSQAAALSGRHFVLPPVSCSSPWLIDDNPDRKCGSPPFEGPRPCWWHGNKWHVRLFFLGYKDLWIKPES